LKRLAKHNLINYLQGIFDHSLHGIAMVDDSGVPFLVNARLCQIIGYSETELTSMSFGQFTHPEDVDRDLKLFEQLRKNEIDHYSIEKRYISKAGHVTPVKIHVTPVKSTKEDPWHAIALIEDISRQKKATQKIKAADQRAKDLNNLMEETWEIAKIGSWEANLETKEVIWSKPVYKIHGVPLGEAIDMDKAFGFFHPDYRAVAQKIIAKCIEAKEAWNIDLKIIARDGAGKWVKTIGQPVFHNDIMLGLRGILQDITEVKEANIKLALYNSTLEETVSERTRQLENVNKELEAFAYSVSHDLRAPLRAIDGFSNALTEDYLDILPDTAQRYLTRISDNSTRMGKLIDSLLSFSRLSRSQTSFQSFGLEERIDSIIHSIDPPIHCKITKENLGDVYGDRMLLDHVFQNLLSNAIKYSSRESAPKVHIKQISHQDSDEIIISDNGVGFDMAYYDQLFNIFQRLHTETEFEGSGVGLALCQKIILKHHGKIWAESKVGEGSTFCVSLPKKSIDNQLY